MRFVYVALACAGCFLVAPLSAQQTNPNLFPQYQPRPQTDTERLNTFRPPPPPPPSYPNISGGNSGDPRLNLNPNVSVGGNVSPNSVEGNIRFPIPGQ